MWHQDTINPDQTRDLSDLVTIPRRAPRDLQGRPNGWHTSVSATLPSAYLLGDVLRHLAELAEDRDALHLVVAFKRIWQPPRGVGYRKGSGTQG